MFDREIFIQILIKICIFKIKSDTTFRDEYRIRSKLIKTITHIVRHGERNFREDFILPFLTLIASQNSQQQSKRGPAKRLESATYLFEAYSALTCYFYQANRY